MENRSGTVVDRRGDDRVNYPLPGGGTMPAPRKIAPRAASRERQVRFTE
jgi:hypothetical protein